MLPHRFKIIFLPGGSSKKNEFNFTRKLFILCVGAFALAFLLLAFTTGGILYGLYSARQLSALDYKNSELENQLALTSEKMDLLNHRVQNLAESGNDLRANAHLPLLDSGTLQMGIGGALPYQENIKTGAEELLAMLEQLDRQISLQENSLLQVRDKLATQEKYLRSVPSIKPVGIGAISSLFGRRRDPFTGQWEPHLGVDFCAPTGTPIYSTADGKIVNTSRQPGFGKALVIDHGNGYRTLYAHMHKFYVKKGQTVKRGDPIGEIGNTGRSTGPHLHYEVIKDNNHQDPLDFMFDGYAMARLP